MHKFLITLTLIFVTGSTVIHGQFFKYKSTSVSIRYKLDEKNWSDWSEPREAIILITIDVNNDRITIYSSKTQIYEILIHEDKIVGDDIYSHYCLGENGKKCRVNLVLRNSKNKLLQLYVNYPDVSWVYNIYPLD